MNIFLLIANILCMLAFFVHTFQGDKEIRSLEPTEGPALKLLGRWVMARCAWHWVSIDILFATLLLTYINLGPTDSLPHELLLLLSIYFASYGLVWLFTIVISRPFAKNYLYLGQWILLLTIAACVYFGYKGKLSNSIAATAASYYEVYKQRSDWGKFLDFYADDVVLEDFVGGYKIEGKIAFAEFFNWEDPRFVKSKPNALEISTQKISGNTVVTQGHFTPFRWGDIKVEAMQFSTILEFDNRGKIIKHTDWINYPDYLIDYSKRDNSNDWIK